MKKLTQENIIDILYGCTVLGTGGGGNLEDGIAVMEQDFKEGKELYLASLDELPDEAYIATPYCCGAPAALDAEEDEKYKELPHIGYPASILAFRSLEEYFGEKFFAVSSTELGGANTAEALHTACQLGIPLMDGDPAGRSVPELQHSSYFVKNKPINPMTVATEYGDVVILKDVVDDFRAEEIARSIACVSGAMVGVADHPMKGKDYKESIIPNAISYAMKIGEELRKARESGKDGEGVAGAIADAVEGKVLFKGSVEKTPWEQTGGFNIGEIYLTGTDTYAGEKYKIWFKNENIIAYRNDQIDVTAPDLICMIGADGIPVTSPNFQKGMEINVLVLPSPDIWKTKEGLECFGPRHFGFDVDYIPFNEKK
ncbi:DUF917 domain-containing protein [Aminipila luticellarii]|uniref:DUF917 domain-containing protein n=1 Tax=Aminipila luticellarii TaxID=2507160 RepID=A0A410PT70_9FIRM|nr:DUF917 domain-containing protein [Aminipila luticellarii]QAT42167.1 DUF917 domain-containing protein [Aminipila luticellarii]